MSSATGFNVQSQLLVLSSLSGFGLLSRQVCYIWITCRPVVDVVSGQSLSYSVSDICHLVSVCLLRDIVAVYL